MRSIVLKVQASLTLALSYVPTNYIQNTVTQALIKEGFSLNNVNVSDTVNSFNIIIVGSADNRYTDEQIRLRIQQVLSEIQTRTNYGIFTGNYYNLFNSVVVQIVDSATIPRKVKYEDPNKKISLFDLLGLGGDFAEGAGSTTPIVIGLGVLFLFLYLKK